MQHAEPQSRPDQRPTRWEIFRMVGGRQVVLVVLLGAVGLLLWVSMLPAPESRRPPITPSAELTPDGDRAYEYLVRICRLGPRYSGSRGMQAQQELIAEHFRDLGARVGFQTFDVPHPLNGRPVRMRNLLVTWHPEAEKRVLLACHYDTRPFPDRDPINPRGRFIGANDGASGVALLMELGHQMKDLDPACGVDFVFFDGEELVYGERGKYFHGSKYFSRQYRADPPPHDYVSGVLVDMVGDRHLRLYKEKNSVQFAPELTASLWTTARRLGVEEFVDRVKFDIRDDHIPLNRIAEIPTCDIIDFEYPHWHTRNDVPGQCSGESLQKVGLVILHWLKDLPASASPD